MHLDNIDFSIIEMEEGNSIWANEEQPEKQESPILDTVAGISILFNEEQPEKEE